MGVSRASRPGHASRLAHGGWATAHLSARTERIGKRDGQRRGTPSHAAHRLRSRATLACVAVDRNGWLGVARGLEIARGGRNLSSLAGDRAGWLEVTDLLLRDHLRERHERSPDLRDSQSVLRTPKRYAKDDEDVCMHVCARLLEDGAEKEGPEHECRAGGRRGSLGLATEIRPRWRERRVKREGSARSQRLGAETVPRCTCV